MTVLICIPCLLTGGTEIQTLSLVRALVRGGYRVVVACYYEHSEGMVARYREAGAEVDCFEPEGKRLGGWRGIRFLARQLRRCVSLYRPQIAHVQYMAPGAQPILILKALGVRKIFATTHTDAQIYPSLRLVHFLQRRIVDVFTCITEIAERQFFGSSRLYTGEEKLPPHAHITIHNALPPHIELREAARPAPRGPLTIGVVSRLEHIKGMDLVIPAFAELYHRDSSLRLLVVGDGSLRPSMEQQAQELGVSEAVTWTGRCDQARLQAVYDRIDLFWMPSRSEGFGLSALEAMARGCAVVAARVGGLPELLQEGRTGRLVEPDSAQALAEASAALLRDRGALECAQEAAWHRAADFTETRYQELMLSLYRKEGAWSS